MSGTTQMVTKLTGRIKWHFAPRPDRGPAWEESFDDLIACEPEPDVQPVSSLQEARQVR